MTDLATIAATGHYLDTLKALRDRLATQIDVTDSGRDMAALSNRLMQTLKAIAEAESSAVQRSDTPLDEIERRRSKRKRRAKGNL